MAIFSSRSQSFWQQLFLVFVLCVFLSLDFAHGLKSRRYGLKGRRSRGLNKGTVVDNPPAIPRQRKYDRGPMEKLNMWIDGNEIEQFVGM